MQHILDRGSPRSGLRLIVWHHASPIVVQSIDPQPLPGSGLTGGSLHQSVDCVDTVYLISVKANLSEIDSEIFFEKDDDFYCVYRLQASTEQQGILIRQRLIISAASQEILYELMYLGLSLHGSPLDVDEE